MKKLIVRCHGIGPLVDLAAGVDTDGRGAEAAARCLWNLAVDDDNKVQIAPRQAPCRRCAVLSSKGEPAGRRPPPARCGTWPCGRRTALIIEGGAAPPLVALLKSADAAARKPPLRAWNLAYESPENQAALSSCIEPLVVLCGAGAAAARAPPPARCGTCCMRTPVIGTPPPASGAGPREAPDRPGDRGCGRAEARRRFTKIDGRGGRTRPLRLQCDADRVGYWPRNRPTLATKPRWRICGGPLPKTLAAMMRRLTPKSLPPKEWYRCH